MSHSHVVLAVSAAWTLIAVVLFVALGTMSFLGVALLMVGGFVPPLVYAALSGEPSATMAEVLHDTDQGGNGR